MPMRKPNSPQPKAPSKGRVLDLSQILPGVTPVMAKPATKRRRRKGPAGLDPDLAARQIDSKLNERTRLVGLVFLWVQTKCECGKTYPHPCYVDGLHFAYHVERRQGRGWRYKATVYKPVLDQHTPPGVPVRTEWTYAKTSHCPACFTHAFTHRNQLELDLPEPEPKKVHPHAHH